MEEKIIEHMWSEWMADTLISKIPKMHESWGYPYGVACKGLQMVYEHTGNRKYLDYIESNMDFLVNEDGTIKYYKPEIHNIDNINNGKMLLYLYEQTKDPAKKEKYYKAATQLREQLKEQPRTTEGGFWHKDIYPHQMWLDGLYMAEPFYAQYVSMFEEKENYDDIILQFAQVEKHMKNSDTELYYHGWDESRQMFWADKETGRSANYWGRSIGWFACALMDTLDYMEGEERRCYLIKLVQNLAKGIVGVQSEKNGLWYQVLDKENEFGNYPETSCSCMFTYFLLKSVDRGYISRDYFAAAKKAFYAIVREFIEIDQDSLLNIKGTVLVSGLGAARQRDGSYEYYTSEPKQTNNLLGIGAFMMAAVELEKLIVEEAEKM